MGKIETQAEFLRQIRLAVPAVVQDYRLRRDTKIKAQHHAQRTTRGAEIVTVAGENETVCPGQFIPCQHCAECGQRVRVAWDSHRPDVNFILRQLAGGCSHSA